jgi:hypothetical protein
LRKAGAERPCCQQVRHTDGDPAYTGQLLDEIRTEKELLGLLASDGTTTRPARVIGFVVHRPAG